MGRGRPADGWEERVRESFARQAVMRTIGAELAALSPGEVEIRLPYREDLTQQHGFLHAGVVTTILDSACGYAAFSLMPSGSAVLTVEYKVNLLAPARGDLFRALGTVLRPGRTLTVCRGEVLALAEGEETAVALMQATMMRLEDRPGIPDG